MSEACEGGPPFPCPSACGGGPPFHVRAPATLDLLPLESSHFRLTMPRPSPLEAPATDAAARRPQPVARSTAATAAPAARIGGALLIGLVAFALVGQLLWMDPTIDEYDESIVLVGADRVLAGGVPYRDFWTFYGPGSFYLLAGVFRLFGETAFVGRVLDATVKSAIVGLTFLILQRFGGRALAVGGALLVLAVLALLRNYGIPLFPALAATLGAVFALGPDPRTPTPRRAAIAGALIGLAALFRHDIGAYAFLACALFQGFSIAHAPNRSAASSALAAPVRAFMAGLLLVVLPVALALVAVVPWRDLYRDLVEIPLFVYPGARSLPFPPIGETLAGALRDRSVVALGPLAVYLPIVAVAIGLAVEADRRRRAGPHTPAPAAAALLRLLMLLDVMLFAKGLVRVSPLHMSPSLVVSAMVVAAAAMSVERLAWRRLLLAGFALPCALVIAKPLARAAHDDRIDPEALFGARWFPHAAALCADDSLPRVRCLRLQSDRATVARYLLEHGAAGQRVYVGARRHDKLFVCDLALYFAAELELPTRWHDLHPGVQTTRPIQSEMIEELSSAPLRYVVIDPLKEEVVEPNASAESSGVTLLDDWLHARFHPVFRAGKLTVLAPNQASGR